MYWKLNVESYGLQCFSQCYVNLLTYFEGNVFINLRQCNLLDNF